MKDSLTAGIWGDSAPTTHVEMANAALRFIRYIGDDVRCTPESGWLVWCGTTWQTVDDAVIRSYLHDLGGHLRAGSERVLNTTPLPPGGFTAAMRASEALKKAASMAHTSRDISATLTEMRACRGVLVSVTEFDRDLDSIGAANGVVNLRTGEIRPYEREDYITRAVRFDYDPAATAPLWGRYLETTMVDAEGCPDPEYAAFMARLVGYGITGRTQEHAFAVLYGEGENGKTIFVETLKSLFSEFSRNPDYAAFEAKQDGSAASPAIAALRSARLVMTSEGNANQPMNEAVLKRITGGDTFSARELYGKPFEFVPQFLLMMMTNYKPVFKGQDHGLWRRVKLLPFNAKFVPGDPRRIDDLEARLQAEELPGVFAWAVAGAREWYAGGLRVPASIRQETEDYRQESDRLGEFIAWAFGEPTGERSDVVSLKDAWTAYQTWCDEVGEGHGLGRTNLGRELAGREGISKVPGSRPGFRGVRLLTLPQRQAASRPLHAVPDPLPGVVPAPA